MKRAVCIGLNRVDPRAYGGWSGVLSDCELDARVSAEMLESHGVPALRLYTQSATRDMVRLTLWASCADMQPGDTLVVWTSGHGGQVPDTSGDEADGVDEYLCLYDGPLSDDIVADWLRHVPKGVNVLWLCDTCHSGTMHRGSAAIEALRPDPAAFPEEFEGNLVLISGCTEAGTSLSTGRGGMLSLALLSEDWRKHTPLTLYDAVRGKINPRDQEPQVVLWGDLAGVFAGEQLI